MTQTYLKSAFNKITTFYFDKNSRKSQKSLKKDLQFVRESYTIMTWKGKLLQYRIF